MNLKSKFIIYNYSDLEDYLICSYLPYAIQTSKEMKQGDIKELTYNDIIIIIEKQENSATFVLKNKKEE